MRKLGKIFLITIMLLGICTVTAFADMGSKPRVQIDIKNPPQEKYYLDLLYYTEYYDRYSNIDTDDDYDDKMLALLTGYDDSGWVSAIASGTSLPMWGSLEPDENGRHIFGYFGVPDEFKIIIVTESGQIKVSDVIKRKTMEVDLTLDYNDMSHTLKPVWTAYIAQFAITFSVTIAVEFIVLAIFFMAKKANLKPFLHMNIITQLLLTAFMSTGFIYGGTIIAYMWFPVIELVIFIFEMWYSKKYFIGENDLMKLAYAFVANTASAMLTFFSLETIMDIMFKVIR